MNHHPTVRPSFATLFAALLCVSLAIGASAETPQPSPVAEPAPAESPMEGMARLVGGAWKIGPLTHVFEWGIGRHTLLARSYDGAGNLASEARWFWHPGEKTIRGYSIDASGENLAEMTTTVEGDTMTNVLVFSNPERSGDTFVGEWVFVGPDRYDWTLYKKTETGSEKQFEATGTRSSQIPG